MAKRLVPVLVSLLMFGITLSALGQERALLVELTFNPVGPEYEDGRLNPFSVKAIREAMNLLLDREFIAREIYTRYKETARPWLFPVSPAFLGTLGLTDLAAELAQKYAYNFEKGKAVIHEEMTKLGAVLRDNVWYYKNAPVKVKVIGRAEDERKPLAEYIALQLQKLGFEVEYKALSAREATAMVMSDKPEKGEWDLFTGAWLVSVGQDEEKRFEAFYTPRGLNYPLWQAYKPDPVFDAVARKLANKEYGNQKELKDLVTQALELCLKDSVRIWLIFVPQ